MLQHESTYTCHACRLRPVHPARDTSVCIRIDHTSKHSQIWYVWLTNAVCQPTTMTCVLQMLAQPEAMFHRHSGFWQLHSLVLFAVQVTITDNHNMSCMPTDACKASENSSLRHNSSNLLVPQGGNASVSHIQTPLYIRCDIGRNEDVRLALSHRPMAGKTRDGAGHCSRLWAALPLLVQQAEGPFCHHMLSCFG